MKATLPCLSPAQVLGAMIGLCAANTHAQTPPPNDDIGSATVIPSLPYTNTVDTTYATAAADDPTPCGIYDRTVWYTLTLDHDASVRAFTRLSNGQSGSVSAFSGTPGNFVLEGCPVFPGLLAFNAQAGRTYYLMVEGAYQAFHSLGGNVQLTVLEYRPPPNDDFSNAIPISSFPSTNTETAFAATRAPDDPVSCIGGVGPTVWYVLAPEHKAFIQVSGPYSVWPGLSLSVYTGTQGALQSVGCPDLGVFGFPVDPGTKYYFMVDAGDSLLPSTFIVEEFPLLNIGAHVEPVAYLDPFTRSVMIHGTVTNSSPATIHLSGTILQQYGQSFYSFGSFYSTIQSSRAANWSVQVFAQSGAGFFENGPALVTLTALGADPPSVQAPQVEISRTVAIQLRSKSKMGAGMKRLEPRIVP
ncbi:MAG: hypothetical protein C5B50_24560 [Verrucomicrobia bacterium]|nr:MAG: hypothetical protein C5B50_24560 [Verrucomicrobiota bacterium]